MFFFKLACLKKTIFFTRDHVGGLPGRIDRFMKKTAAYAWLTRHRQTDRFAVAFGERLLRNAR